MNTKILAVGIVAILVVGGIGAFAINNMNKGSDGITIVDGSGKEITLDSKLTNVAVINSNIPRALIMLGVDDTITCYHYSKATGRTYEETATKLGTYYTPSVEVLLEKKVQAVLCPVSSMTLYASYQTACENVGIKVIRLDCNGATLFDDLQKISKLYGEPDSATKIIDEYTSNYNAIKDAITKALNGKEKTEYMSTFSSRNAIYNHTSAIDNTFKTVFGRNITQDTDLSTKGVTNEINTNTLEVIHGVQDKIQTFVIRAIADESSLAQYTEEYKLFVGDGKLVTSDCTAVKNGETYVMINCLMSGLYAPFGILIMAEAVYDIDISVTLTFDGKEHTYNGLSEAASAISDFQTRYNQSEIEKNNVLLAQFNSSGAGTAVLTY